MHPDIRRRSIEKLDLIAVRKARLKIEIATVEHDEIMAQVQAKYGLNDGDLFELHTGTIQYRDEQEHVVTTDAGRDGSGSDDAEGESGKGRKSPS